MNIYTVEVEQHNAAGVLYSSDSYDVAAHTADTAIAKARSHAWKHGGYLKTQRIDVVSVKRIAEDVL